MTNDRKRNHVGIGKLKEHMLSMNNEDYSRYGAGISYSIGWLKSWLSVYGKLMN